MRKFLLAASALAALVMAAPATAADMPVKARPLPPPPPVFSWTGFYIGAHVGSAWATTESSLNSISVTQCFGALCLPADSIGGLSIPISSHNINGFLGGVQGGYNWQFAPWGVFGIETQWSWSDLNGTTPCVVILACTTDTKWVGTLAARLGFVVDRALIYVKGGVGWAHSEYTVSLNLQPLVPISISSSVSDTRIGAMWGAGVEYAFTQNWSAKIEYDFIDFRNKDYNFAAAFSEGPDSIRFDFGSTIRERVHLVKFGINYRFDFGKYPVVARY